MVDLAAPGQGITPMELALATRNRGMPLEALRYDTTPIGLHYLLIHFDIPAVDPGSWSLRIEGRVRPGWYGMTSVKWLARIEAVAEPFRGYHQAVAYTYQQSEDDPGVPVDR